MTSLLVLLRDHAEAVEADLSRYHHLDYRDRWRRDEHGRRCLTVRMIGVRVRHLPADSAVRTALGEPAWDLTHYLLSDVFHATSGKPHPGRPSPSVHAVPTRERVRKMNAARRRAAARRAAIARGEIT